ncbi:MAG: hypothetical protein ACXW3L_03350 [Limisphaerales bacterium]
MKWFLSLFSALSVLVLLGCASTSNDTDSGAFMTKFGESRVGDVIVAVRATDHKLVVSRANSRATVQTLPTWNAQEGWFVFVREGDVWAYDGKDDLLLVTQRGVDRTTTMSIYSKGQYPVAVPPQVVQRLKEPLRSQVAH